MSPVLTKKNAKAHLIFAKKYIHHSQDVWENFMRTDKTKLNFRSAVKLTQHFIKTNVPID